MHGLWKFFWTYIHQTSLTEFDTLLHLCRLETPCVDVFHFILLRPKIFFVTVSLIR
jgi:hypothetical protein